MAGLVPTGANISTAINVMAGLVPRVSGSTLRVLKLAPSTTLSRHGRSCSGYPRLVFRAKKDVDGRDKRGHDDWWLCNASEFQPIPPNRTLVGLSQLSEGLELRRRELIGD